MTAPKTFSTLGDLLALFGPEALGPRTRGSTTARGLDAVHPSNTVEEFEPVPGARFGAARYFRVRAPEVVGKLGAVRLGDLADESKAIMKRRAAPHGHGDELYLDQPPEKAGLVVAYFVTVIVGPADETPNAPLVGWTWHPGEPLAPLAPGAEPTNETGVKLHNGA